MRLSIKYFILFAATTKAITTTEIRSLGALPQEEEVSRLELLAQYAGAAYCYHNTRNTGASVACSISGGNCSKIESANTTILNGFSNVGDSWTNGFVALDDTHQLIVTTIQGTDIAASYINIITDLDVKRIKADLCGPQRNLNDGCLVHGGFWRAMVDIRDVVIDEVTRAHATHRRYRIAVTGHSLGGAVAALMGATLRNAGFVVDIYTYGQPYIGATDVANTIQSQAPGQGMNYRVVHDADIVPRIPIHYETVWEHFYPEYFIRGNEPVNGVWDVEKIEWRIRDPSQHESFWRLLLDTVRSIGSSHRYYFGDISVCITKLYELWD